MISLNEILKDRLDLIADRVYRAKNVPQDAEYPFVVFEPASNSNIEDMDLVMVDIDIWDKMKPLYDIETEIETLTEKVIVTLVKYKYVNEKIAVKFDFESRLSFKNPDVDKNLYRRQVRLVARTFFLGGS